MLMTPPQVQEVMAPLSGITVLEGILARADRPTRGFEPGLQGVDLDGLPSSEVHRIVGLVITVMQIDQIMGPDITPLAMIIQISDLVKMLAIVSS